MEGKTGVRSILTAAAVLATAAVFATVYLPWGGFERPPEELVLKERRDYTFTLADNEEKRVKGLSGREYLPENAVLLFTYESDNSCAVWMKGMSFEIDVVWLDKDFKVIDFAERLSPDTFPKIFSPSLPCRYFIEANTGFVKANSISLGKRALLDFVSFSLSF